ncbi:hypothetical protein LEMLEM_LOCUS1256, partial [Lemmus lemmus]
ELRPNIRQILGLKRGRKDCRNHMRQGHWPSSSLQVCPFVCGVLGPPGLPVPELKRTIQTEPSSGDGW